jgi:hypothetical protein
MRVELGFKDVVSASVRVAVRPRWVFQNESAVSAILPGIPEARTQSQRPLGPWCILSSTTQHKSKQRRAMQAGTNVTSYFNKIKHKTKNATKTAGRVRVRK